MSGKKGFLGKILKSRENFIKPKQFKTKRQKAEILTCTERRKEGAFSPTTLSGIANNIIHFHFWVLVSLYLHDLVHSFG